MSRKAIDLLSDLIGQENCTEDVLETVDGILFIRADKVCKPLYCNIFKLIFENWQLYNGARYGIFRVLVREDTLKQYKGNPSVLGKMQTSKLSAYRIYVPVSWAVRIYGAKHGTLLAQIRNAKTPVLDLGCFSVKVWYDSVEALIKAGVVSANVHHIYDLRNRTVTFEY